MPGLTLLLAALVVAALFSLVSNLCVAALAALCRCPMREVRLFSGPTILALKLRGVRWSLGLIPLGNVVYFVEEAPHEDVWRPDPAARAGAGGEMADVDWRPAVPQPSPKERMMFFENRSVPVRLGLILVGYCAIFVGVSIVLGLDRAAASVMAGWMELPSAVFDRQLALDRLTAANELVGTSKTLFAAVFATKLLALNLLPIPPWTGGHVLTELASVLLQRKVRWPDLLVNVGVVLSLMMVMGWLFALEKM